MYEQKASIWMPLNGELVRVEVVIPSFLIRKPSFLTVLEWHEHRDAYAITFREDFIRKFLIYLDLHGFSFLKLNLSKLCFHQSGP